MARLNYDDILYIYKLISLERSMLDISRELNVNPSTIYRLIKNNRFVRQTGMSFRSYKYKDCIHLDDCRKRIKSCPDECERYHEKICSHLQKFPFICNFCLARKRCTKKQYLFNPDQVYKERQLRLISSRKHITISKHEFKRFNNWISPLIKNGISIEVLYHSYPEHFPVSTSTLRRWINDGYLKAKRIDLRRAVKFKIKKQYQRKRPYNYDPLVKYGHTYRFFLNYIQSHPHASIMELDTVHGLLKEKTKLLTMYHRKTHFQIGILIKDIKAITVRQALINMQKLLGLNYLRIFEVILADNGFEFDRLIEASTSNETGEVYSQVFYTKPYCSGDKGGCERNHEFFRYFIPKRKPIQHLIQDDVNYMFSQINSYPREALNWKSPIDLFSKRFSPEIIHLLGYQKVDIKDINFKMNHI